MICSSGNESRKVFYIYVMRSVRVVQQKEVNVMFSLAFGAEILHAEILIVLIQ